jgi:hypothetical protein
MIGDSLRKIHMSENREKITVQRLIYQGVNWSGERIRYYKKKFPQI